MRVVATCEKCGATAQVYRHGWGATLEVDHICDTRENACVHGPLPNGPVHIRDAGRRR